ncbi:MAG: NAD-dependent epimerase/dehydratase family protein [Thermoplasmatota archaeon]
MKAFVTGADGFLGSHLCRRLAADGWTVATLPGDLFERGAFASAADADVIFHLAALSYVPDAKASPATASRVNIDGTLAALEAARASRARLVFMSSSHVYGNAGAGGGAGEGEGRVEGRVEGQGGAVRPIVETDAIAPVSIYGATKAAAEALLWAYKHTHGVPVVAVRAFNVYGPGQRGAFVVPEFAARVHAGGPLTMGDPRPVRDFVYVDDAIDFLVAAATAPKAAGEAINLAAGIGVSIGDLGKTMLRVAGKKEEIAPSGEARRSRASGEASVLVGSRVKAERVLGWNPRVALEDGLRRTIQSYAVKR